MENLTSDHLKRHLGAVLDDAMRGQSYVITRHGRPVAVIGPAPSDVVIKADKS
jgi:prevent-host-death family protein